MRELNIKILGFSFTGYGNELSFGKIFESQWNFDNNVKINVVDISYGGLSINALSGLVGGALKESAPGDVICLEVATSFYSQQAHTVKDAKKFILYLIDYLASRKLRFFFLNLYRVDLDDNDCVVQAIQHYADEFNIKILDLKKEFRKDIAINNNVLTEADLVHPNFAARSLIASKLEYFIRENINLFAQINYKRIDEMKIYSYHDVTINSDSGMGTYLYEGRGKSINSIVLLPNTRLKISFDVDVLLKGFYFLYGPETGYVSLKTDSKTVELITYDENSYYRRVGFRPIDLFCKSLEILSEPRIRDIKLVRETSLKVESRRDFVCGFLIEK